EREPAFAAGREAPEGELGARGEHRRRRVGAVEQLEGRAPAVLLRPAADPDEAGSEAPCPGGVAECGQALPAARLRLRAGEQRDPAVAVAGEVVDERLDPFVVRE